MVALTGHALTVAPDVGQLICHDANSTHGSRMPFDAETIARKFVVARAGSLDGAFHHDGRLTVLPIEAWFDAYRLQL